MSGWRAMVVATSAAATTTVGWLTLGAPVARAAAPTIDVAKLLADVDRAHGATTTGVTYHASLRSVLTDGRVAERTYEVSAQGAAALAVVTAPPDYVGDKVLMMGLLVWQRARHASQPQIVPAADRLSGLACVADIVASVFSARYDGKVTGVEGTGAAATLVVALTAKSPEVPFEAAQLWVDQATHRPTRALFTTKDGKPLRAATYTYGLPVGKGKKAWTMVEHMTVTDEEAKSFTAEVAFADAKLATLPKDLLTFKTMIGPAAP